MGLLGLTAAVFGGTKHIMVQVCSSGMLNAITLHPLGMRTPDRDMRPVRFTAAGGGRHYADVSVTHPGMYKVGDGYSGHLIFLDTRTDTLLLTLTLRKDYRAGKFFMKLHTLSARARYPADLTYFDRLETKVGDVVKYENYPGISSLAFKAKCDSGYDTGLQLLAADSSKGLLSPDFPAYARAELAARYVMYLCSIFTSVPRNEIPATYLERLRGWTFDNDTLARYSKNYITAASVYNVYVYNDFDLKWRDADFLGNYRSATTYYHGIIRNRLQAWILDDFKDRELPEFDSVYQAFRQSAPAWLTKEVTAGVGAWQAKRQALSWNKVLDSTWLLDDRQHRTPLRKVLAGSRPLIIVDNWATWCAPCREQEPALDRFRKKYRDQVSFIFLSIDKDRTAWKKVVSRGRYTENEQHFLISTQADNPLFNFLDISTIPRYILLSANGAAVLEKDMPLPVLQSAFEKIIKQYFPSTH